MTTIPQEVTGKIPAQLFFNKANGKLVTVGSAQPLEHIEGKEYYIIVDADFDMINDKVVGDYPDYKIVSRADAPQEYYESQADGAMAAKITKRYPVVEQVNVLGRAIQALAKFHGEELEELTEMLEYIKLCKDTSRSTKEFYRDSPDYIYISNEQAAEDFNAQFEGGLHEFIGARTIEGGRVFA